MKSIKKEMVLNSSLKNAIFKTCLLSDSIEKIKSIGFSMEPIINQNDIHKEHSYNIGHIILLLLLDGPEDKGVFRKIPVRIMGAHTEPVQPYLIEPKLTEFILENEINTCEYYISKNLRRCSEKMEHRRFLYAKKFGKNLKILSECRNIFGF